MAASQHQNGILEIIKNIVKTVKKAFLRVLGDMRLTLNETFTMLTEITIFMNYCPIKMKPRTSLEQTIHIQTCYCWVGLQKE